MEIKYRIYIILFAFAIWGQIFFNFDIPSIIAVLSSTGMLTIVSLEIGFLVADLQYKKTVRAKSKNSI